MVLLIFGMLFLIFASNLEAKPPPNTVKCDTTSCTVTNGFGAWYDRRICSSPSVRYPTTEEELRQAVAYANQNILKVKVVTKFSHSVTKLACPSSQTINTMLISTEFYNSMIEIDTKNMLVTVDTGVSLREMINKVEEAGLSLVAAPYWEGLSVGGLISTGAHGSSWWGNGGAVHDHVVGLSLVVPGNESEGFAKVLRLEGNDPFLKASKVALGVLGVISKVILSLEEVFKRSITLNFKKDEGIENDYIKHAKNNEFGDITWYPSQHTAVYRYDNRVSMNISEDGENDFIGFQSQSILVSTSARSLEKTYESSRDTNGKCMMATTLLESRKHVANGLKSNELSFTGYPVIGTQGKMQTSGSCLYSSHLRVDLTCAWDPSIKGLRLYESAAFFPASKFRDFIRGVKELRDINPQKFCGIDMYNGILIRFIKASDAYLGQAEDSVVIDFNYFWADDPKVPRLNQDVFEEIEQMAFFKYGARPHWAKNRNLAFKGVPEKYPNWGKFIDAKEKLDPNGMFSSEWSDEILFGKSEENEDGCALDGLCVCSQDSHCSPSQGYFCEYGLVYQEARVCRFRHPKIP